MISDHRRPWRWSAALAALALVAASPLSAQERTLDAAAPMLEVFFEGIPYEEAVELGDDAIAGLIAVLDDPARIRNHANALVALGMNGSPSAYPVIFGYANRGMSGELDRASFRALRAVPYAMGHLARTDRRALEWLIDAVGIRNAPERRFGHMDRDRLDRLLRRAAMTGLALSGQPRAERVLNRLARSNQPIVRKHALESLAEHDRIATFGAHAVLSPKSRELR